MNWSRSCEQGSREGGGGEREGEIEGWKRKRGRERWREREGGKISTVSLRGEEEEEEEEEEVCVSDL